MPRKSTQTIPYNAQAVRRVATKPHERQTDYTIQGVQGLVLTVLQSGTASFAVRYSVNGKRRREVLGRYGVVRLEDVRARALEIGAGAARGVDAVAAREAKGKMLTLKQLFEERRAKDTETTVRTMDDYLAVLTKYVFPVLGDKAAGDITPEELAGALEPIAARGKHHTAHKVRSALGSTYRWGQRQWKDSKRLVSINPVTTIGFTHQSKRRKRVLSDAELGRLWQATETTESVTLPMRQLIKLAILTSQRNSEVAGMELGELKSLESATPRWDIPAHRMKRKSDDQYVPLSKQAAALVKQAIASGAGGGGVHVFEGPAKGRRDGTWRKLSMHQEGVSRAFARIAKVAGLADVHLHDMRKCVTSWLAEHGHATPEVLDAILHHGRKGVTGTHYNFALYEGQVRKALQAWADHVESVTKGAGAGNPAEKVVHLRA